MHPLEHYRKNPQEILSYLESLRKPMVRIGCVAFLCSVAGFFLAEPILRYLHDITHVPLASYGIPETFFSLLSIALLFGFFASEPYILYTVLTPIPSLFPSFSRKVMLVFWVVSIVLFYTGAFFCLRVSLPYGAKFLVGFENQDVQAMISTRKFVSFCTFFVFGFGTIFQMPLAMILLGRLGLLKVQMLTHSRRYAILSITVIAALLTPTPDVVNMMLMAVPLYLLFELGILGMRLWAK